MQIKIAFTVRFIDAVSGAEMPVPSFVPGFKMTDDNLEAYFDAEIADEGIVGGNFYLNQKSGQPVLEIVYWHPDMPNNRSIDLLRADAIAQLDDGIGEGGFQIDCEGEKLIVVANTEESVFVEMIDDARAISGPSRVAIAARDGDLARLAAELEAEPNAIHRFHQGCTALHLAILYGHPNAVRRLLAAGADPNLVDLQGVTPLETCALSRSLDDEQSLEVGKMLLDAGGNPKHLTPNGDSARSYAESRGKKSLAAIL